MLRRTFVFLIAIAVSVIVGAAPAQAGDGVTFVIQNGSDKSLTLKVEDAWNCIEPDLTVGFIGAQLTLAPGRSYSKVLWRRDGHGCDGQNAVWSITPTYGNRTFTTQQFSLTGDGGIFHGGTAADYVSVFNDGTDAANTYTWQLYMDPASPDPQLTNKQKDALLRHYAPKIWLANDEPFTASSVEFAFQNMTRVSRDGQYWLYTKADIGDGNRSDLPAYFRGQGANAASYGFYTPKAGGYIDLVYFQYYPYNWGKSLATGTYGNHVSDWETMTVRLDSMQQPVEVILSQHDTGQTIPWSAMPKSGTHPTAWSALGSHGLYAAPGNVVYKTTALGPLVDRMSSGTNWSTGPNLVNFDPTTKTALAGGAWPWWLESANVYRWGNGETGCGDKDFVTFFKDVGAECKLVNGPTGPMAKGAVWDQNVECNAGDGDNRVRTSMCAGPLLGVLNSRSLVGTYRRAAGVQNKWHKGVIRMRGGELRWVTDAGPWWTLHPDWVNRRLVTGTGNPYYNVKGGWTEFRLVVENGVYKGFTFNGDDELYRKVG